MKRAAQMLLVILWDEFPRKKKTRKLRPSLPTKITPKAAMALVLTLFPGSVRMLMWRHPPELECWTRISKKMVEWIIYTWTDPIYPLVLNWPHNANIKSVKIWGHVSCCPAIGRLLTGARVQGFILSEENFENIPWRIHGMNGIYGTVWWIQLFVIFIPWLV